MKIFQIYKGLCYWDATPKHPTLESTVGKYAPDIKFAEAPDYVFEHWGFDETKTGDERFIKPTPPKGWGYDDATGAFYELNPEPVQKASETVTTEELDAAYKEGVNSLE